MKRSIYISKENEAYIEAELNKGKSLSDVINGLIEDRRNTVSFDCWELRSKDNYKLVLFRFPIGLVELLQKLKSNYKSAKIVCYTVMSLLVQEFDRQTRERLRRFPKKYEADINYINRAIDSLRKL